MRSNHLRPVMSARHAISPRWDMPTLWSALSLLDTNTVVSAIRAARAALSKLRPKRRACTCQGTSCPPRLTRSSTRLRLVSRESTPTKNKLTVKPASFAACIVRRISLPESVVSRVNVRPLATKARVRCRVSRPARAARVASGPGRAAAITSVLTTSPRSYPVAARRLVYVDFPAPFGPPITVIVGRPGRACCVTPCQRM